MICQKKSLAKWQTIYNMHKLSGEATLLFSFSPSPAQCRSTLKGKNLLPQEQILSLKSRPHVWRLCLWLKQPGRDKQKFVTNGRKWKNVTYHLCLKYLLSTWYLVCLMLVSDTNLHIGACMHGYRILLKQLLPKWVRIIKPWYQLIKA